MDRKKIIVWGIILAAGLVFFSNRLNAETWFEGNPSLLAFKDSDGYHFSDTALIEIAEGSARLRVAPWGVFQDFSFKAPLKIKENSGRDLMDYAVSFTIDTQKLIGTGRIKKDCSDIRFGDLANAYPYWLETGCNSPRTGFWVKIPFLAAHQTMEIIMYYDSPGAKSLSDPDSVLDRVDEKNWALGWKSSQSSSCTGVIGWNSLDFDDSKWAELPQVDMDQWNVSRAPCEQCDLYLRKRFISIAPHTNNIFYTVEGGSFRIMINEKVLAEKPLWECHGLGVDSGTIPLPIETGELAIAVQCSHGKGDKKCKIAKLSRLNFLRERKYAAVEPSVVIGPEKGGSEQSGYSKTPQFIETPSFGQGKNIANLIKAKVNVRGSDRGQLKIFYKYSADGGKTWIPNWLGGDEIKETGQSVYLSGITVNNNGSDRIKFKLEMSSADGLGRSLEPELLTLYYNDLEKPRIFEAKSVSPNEIEIVFSEEVLQADQHISYIANGLEIKGVRKINENTYRLQTSSQVTARPYVINIQGVVDMVHNPLENESMKISIKGFDNLPEIENFSIQGQHREGKEKGSFNFTNNRNLKVIFTANDPGGSVAGYLIKENDTPPLVSYKGDSLPLNVTNKFEQPLPKGYPLKYKLTNKIQGAGDDLRVIYFNGSTYEQLPRNISTDPDDMEYVWFENQQEIPGGKSNNNYFLYFGDFSLRSPPLLKNNPEKVIKVTGKVSGNKEGDSLAYFELLQQDYVVEENDSLVYSIMFDPASQNFEGGLEAIFSDSASSTMSLLLNKSKEGGDQYRLGLDPRNDLAQFAKGKWYERRFNLSSLAGYFQIKKWLIALEGDRGSTTFYLANIRIEDNQGKIKTVIGKPEIFQGEKKLPVVWNKNYEDVRIQWVGSPRFSIEPAVNKNGEETPVVFSEFSTGANPPEEYTIKGGEGMTTFYAWALDNTQNLSQPRTGKIDLDFTPPRLNPLLKAIDPYTWEFSFNELLDEMKGISDKTNYLIDPPLPIEKINLIGKNIYEENDMVFRINFKFPQDPTKSYTLRAANLADRAGNIIDPIHSSAMIKATDFGLPVIERVTINGREGSTHYTARSKLDTEIKAHDPDGKITRWLVNSSCQRPSAAFMELRGLSLPPNSYPLREIEGEHVLCFWVMDSAGNVNLLSPESYKKIIFDRNSPELSSINILSNSQVDLVFSENIFSEGGEKTTGEFFSVDGMAVTGVTPIDTQTFRLNFPSPLNAGDHLLTLKNISDPAGNEIKINRKAFSLFPPILNVSGRPVMANRLVSAEEKNLVVLKISLSVPPDSSYPLKINNLKLKLFGDLSPGNMISLAAYSDDNVDDLINGERMLGKAVFVDSGKYFLFTPSTLILNAGDVQDVLIAMDIGNEVLSEKKFFFSFSHDSIEIDLPGKVSTFLPVNSNKFQIK